MTERVGRAVARDEDGFELDADFTEDISEEFSHHGLGRHEFGGDSPKLSPRTARLIRYVPRAHPAGFVLGTAFALISLTPSLIPRDYLFQGLATGISGALGYALGVALAWLLGRTARWTHVTDLLRRISPVWLTPGSWLVLVVTAAVTMLLLLIAGAGWQREIAGLMGMAPTTTDGWLRAGPIAVVVAVLLVGFGRFVRWLGRVVARMLRRWAHLPRRIAGVVGTVIAVLLVAVVIDTLVLRTGFRVVDAAFSATNDETYAGVSRPLDPRRSGSPASLVPWDGLGREGQDFVAGGRPAAQLAAASGRAPVDPIRAYVGLQSAPEAQDRAELAVAELERTGAFDRAVIAVVTTTGTGWIDDPVADSLELTWGGNTAIVASQYSYLPSWLSFLVDRTRAEAEGRALFDAVHARLQQLPPERRPRLLVFGESLGSQGSEAAFSSVEDARAQADGVLWVGPPHSNHLWASLTARRDPGSREIGPVLDRGREVRFAADRADIEQLPEPWAAPRVLYVQHASDPIVTFWQVTIDMTNAQSVPDGHGHNYRSVVLDGWLSLAAPPGWTDADTTRVQGILGV